MAGVARTGPLGLMRNFVRVAEAGGFSPAARDLNVGQTTLSRQVADLGEHLRARLLHRSSTGLSLTEDGAVFLEEARRALAAVEAAAAAVGERRGEVRGRVGLGCPVAFGRVQVVPRLPALLARHPGLEVELVTGAGVSDLVAGGLDLAVRVGELTGPTLVARRVGLTRRALVAAPVYLERSGAPPLAHPRDLAVGHDCVHYTNLATGDEWPFEGLEGAFRVPVRGRLRADSSEAVREAVLAGLGVGLCPLWLFGPELSDGRVVTLLPDWTPTPLPVNAVYASRRGQPARVRAVVEHLAAEFRLDPLLSDHGAPRDAVA